MKNEEYILQLERRVIIPIFIDGVLPAKYHVVPLSGGKLRSTDFASFVGRSFEYSQLLAINYYGYFKLSTGIIEASSVAAKTFKEIKAVRTPVVFFNTLKKCHVKKYDEGLKDDYRRFKDFIVDLRWKS